MSQRLKAFNAGWYGVLALFIVLTGIAFYGINPEGESSVQDADVSPWKGLVDAGFPAYLLAALGLVNAIAGSRLSQRVLSPGWQESSLAHRLSQRSHTSKDPALAVYLLGLALIESTAAIGLALYVLTGTFNAYIVLIGIALLGWITARPTQPSPKEPSENITT